MLEDLKKEILIKYMSTKKPVKSIAKEYNLLYEDVTEILEEFRNIYGDIPRNLKEIKTIPKLEENIYQIREKNEEICKLREQGLTYAEIVENLKKQNIRMSVNTVSRRCKGIYSSKGEEIPKPKNKNYNKISDKSKKMYEEIYKLREEGLSYQKISDKFAENGINITRQRVEQRYKKVLKTSEQQLAKSILNLIITRKATIEQIQHIADYYGVDLEKTLKFLDER